MGGQDKIRPLWRHYFQNTQVFIYVVDSNDRDRIEQSKEELFKLMREEELRDSLLLVMANKQDLSTSMSVDEVKQKLDFDKLNHIKYKTVIGTSAINGNSLSECLDWIKLNYNLSKTMEPISETFEDVKRSLEKSSYFNSIINLASNYFNKEKSIH